MDDIDLRNRCNQLEMMVQDYKVMNIDQHDKMEALRGTIEKLEIQNQVLRDLILEGIRGGKDDRS